MSRFLVATTLVVAACSLFAPFGASAQHDDHAGTLPPGFDEPMPLRTAALGPYGRRITTTSTDAQAFFDQGVQMMYAFAKDEAPRSFRTAWMADSTCAMCYWGEAWSWGSYLNGPMGPDDAPRAHHAAMKASALVGGQNSEVEKRLIAAMAVRYEMEHDEVRRERLDTLYARELAAVWADYPTDPDVGTLYAEALMLLEPRRGNWDAADRDVKKIHSVLESVLALDLKHPGGCHLYVHATESTTVPEKAAACAEFLGTSIPGASHINHMPSHTWNRMGRWGDAVRANIMAWHSDQKAAIGDGFAIYPSHNLHMLLFAASMDGQGAVAVQAGKDYGKIVPGGSFYHALALLRFGRFDEILALDDRPSPPVFRGLWEFAKGYAHLRRGEPEFARAYLERAEKVVAMGDSVNFRGHPAGTLVGSVAGILRGEILIAEGRVDDGIEALRKAVTLEDRLVYDEPEPLNFSARDWLGAALLDAGRAVEAEQVYREAEADHPHNGWALLGIAQALRAQGLAAEANEAQAAFEAAWARSDTWIRGSRF